MQFDEFSVSSLWILWVQISLMHSWRPLENAVTPLHLHSLIERDYSLDRLSIVESAFSAVTWHIYDCITLANLLPDIPPSPSLQNHMNTDRHARTTLWMFLLLAPIGCFSNPSSRQAGAICFLERVRLRPQPHASKWWHADAVQCATRS